MALHQHGGVANPHDAAVVAHEPVFDLEPISGALRPPILLEHALPIVGMDHLPPGLRAGHPLARGASRELFDPGRHVREAMTVLRIELVGEVRDDRELLDELPVAFLGELLFGDVDHDALVDRSAA